MGLEHFLTWLGSRGVMLGDVDRAAVVDYVTEFARGERDGIAPERRKARVMRQATGSVVALLAATPGVTLQQRWTVVEQERWSRWEAGHERLMPASGGPGVRRLWS